MYRFKGKIQEICGKGSIYMPGLFDILEGTDIIAVRKKINRLLREAENASKPERCIICGKEKSSYCNSHSVPQLALKSIADNGKLLQSTMLMGTEIIDIEKGVKNSGTFHFICNECDSIIFQDYENYENLVNYPTDKMLAEIAVKNILLQLSKRAKEEVLIDIMQRKFGVYTNPENFHGINELDIRDYEEELSEHKRVIDENLTGCYQVLYWKKLSYKVPIAVQSAIALSIDLEGNMVNNIYDMRPEVRMQSLHLAIFPLQSESVIFAFYHKKDKAYRSLRHQMNSISEEKKLQYLNYLVFAYTENYFASKSIQHELEENEKLRLLSRENNGLPDLGYLEVGNAFGLMYSPIKKEDIPPK